jgi:hypothetical protein
VPALPRWIVVSCAAAAVVALSGCADVNGSGVDAPDPAKTLPAQIAADVKTDLGVYFARPRPGVSDKDVQAPVERLRSMPGVQSAELTKDGVVDLQFTGGSTHEQHEKAVKQLAAIGDVYEGV